MLIGIHEHQIDQKWRIRLPAKLKESFGSEKLIAYRGANSCLVITTEANFQLMCTSYQQISSITPGKKLEAIRQLMVNSFSLDEDAQGRFSLPISVRNNTIYNFKKDVVSVGMIDRVELWSKNNYQTSISNNDNYDDLLLGLTSTDAN